MVYAENEGEVFLGRSVTKTTNISEKTMQEVDAEVRRIIDEQYALARRLIEENRDKMEAMTKALLEWETIDADQIDDIMEGREPRPPKSMKSTEKAPEVKPQEAKPMPSETEAQSQTQTTSDAAEVEKEDKRDEADQPHESDRRND